MRVAVEEVVALEPENGVGQPPRSRAEDPRASDATVIVGDPSLHCDP
jgi:hypothetical protein